jgi:hypothetical protein
MHRRVLFGVSAILVLSVLLSPAGYGQFKGYGAPQGGFGPGGGYGGPGGGGFGGPGGFGKGGGGKGTFDPDKLFNFMAQGQQAIVINQAYKSMQGPMMQYAQDKGITNGQLTREQFADFMQYLRAQRGNGPPGAATKPGDPPTPQGGTPGSLTLESLQQMADAQFKEHDLNGDGKLNEDEMPRPLRMDLARWDTNKDGLIDQNEYRTYYITRFQERMARASNPGGPPGMQGPSGGALETALIDEELDKRPTVYRAGKLPIKGMPPWFTQLDTDGDGQVALYEWRAAGKDLDEFQDWDRDNDGYITPEEAIHTQAKLTNTLDPLSIAAVNAAEEATNNAGNFGQGGPRGPGGMQFQFPMGGGQPWMGGGQPWQGGNMMMQFGPGKKGFGGPPGGGERKKGFGPPGGSDNGGGRPQWNGGDMGGGQFPWGGKGKGKGKGGMGGG